MLAWIRAQRRLRLASGALRWWLAALGWALSVTNLVVFSVLVR